MNAMTACEAAVFPSEESLNAMVWHVQKMSMPMQDVKNRILLPTRSTRNDDDIATAKFQI